MSFSWKWIESLPYRKIWFSNLCNLMSQTLDIYILWILIRFTQSDCKVIGMRKFENVTKTYSFPLMLNSIQKSLRMLIKKMCYGWKIPKTASYPSTKELSFCHKINYTHRLEKIRVWGADSIPFNCTLNFLP